MSRSGYSEDFDGWELIMYRGAVNSACRGKRGQKLLREMAEALDKMPEKRLIEGELIHEGEVCALGALALHKNIDVTGLDPYDADRVAGVFDIAPSLAREIVFMNDEAGYYRDTPEKRWERVRSWLASVIKK